jgi:hypothetical protein
MASGAHAIKNPGTWPGLGIGAVSLKISRLLAPSVFGVGKVIQPNETPSLFSDRQITRHRRLERA